MVRLLVIVLLAGLAVPPGGSFTDDDGNVHEGAIEAIAAAGITKGCNPPANTHYCPDDPVTRATMAAFLNRALDLAPSGGDRFVDDDGIFEADIQAIAAAGITKGCNPPANTRYCPDDPVTRGQMAAMLARALDLPPAGGDRFVDDDGVFEADVQAIAAAGITKGCNPPANTRYCPDDPVTRAAMASFLARALGLAAAPPPPRPLPSPGNPDGTAAVPAAARAEDTSDPDTVIGDGTPASCTSSAVVDAVARGGVITFDCGPDPHTIVMEETAKVVNDASPEVVIDGGGLITLSGGGERRILYMNTCDPAQVWTTPHCNDQDHPRLTVQHLAFVDGDATGADPDGGGAIWVRGGRFKIVGSTFARNRCDVSGPDVGGGAVRVFDQYRDQPVYVVDSTFGGGPGLGNVCASGGAISSIGVSWTILNSVFSHNDTTGWGANPARPGTPGGGNGGAIYNDGNTMTLRVAGTRVTDNRAREGGGAIFFVSNDRTGHLVIEGSTLLRNPSEGFETAGYPGIFHLGSGPPQVTSSVIGD